MKLLTITLTIGLALFGLAACGGEAGNANTNMNVNRANANLTNANLTNANLSNADMSNANTESLSAVDQFLTEAAQSGLMEVELGRLAASKAQSPEVKAFGQKMVADHGKANAELKALAAKKNIKLPTEISGGMKAEAERLAKLSGAEFDREYVQMMVAAHDEDVEAFEAQADGAEDADVKAFAAKTLPVLRAHYETIQKINDNLK